MTLIDKFGARSYQDPPATTVIAVAKTQQGTWQVATE